MFSGTKLVLVLLFLFVGVLLSVRADEKEPAMKRLLSEDFTVVKEAQDELLTARAHLTSDLINIVESEQNLRRRQASVEAAMLILGEMRATEAVKVLVANIAFPNVLPAGPEPSPGLVRDIIGGHRDYLPGELRSAAPEVWPAVAALIKIGEPCLPEVITKLSTSGNEIEEHACLGVLLGLRDHPAVEAMLKDALAKETDPKGQGRFQASLNILSQIE